MKVEIGSKYTGERLDRPALRRLPTGWTLEETRRTPTFWRVWFAVERLICALSICILIYAFADWLARL